MTTIQLSDIILDRARKDLGDLTGLSDSLHNIGSIHPITVSQNADGTYTLIAGGRRLAAGRKLGYTVAHHGSVLEPGRIGFLFKEEVPPDIQKEAEIDENLYRLGMPWQENVLLVADIHKLKVSKHGRGEWGQKQTADLLGKGYGRAKVSIALELAERLRAGDEQLISCPTISDGISILLKRREDEALKELHRRASAGGMVSTDSFLDQIHITTTAKPVSKNEPVKPVIPVVIPFQPATENQPTIVPLSSMFHRADFRELCPKLSDGCFDHIVTDIPYGIDMDNLEGIKNIQDIKDEHGVEQNIDLMEPFLREAFRLTKSGGFCVFFYDLNHHEKLQSWARDIGWKVQRWPVIIHKLSPCRNNAAQYNTTKNYECAMYLRRDEQTVLRRVVTSSVRSYDFSVERKLYNNPFAKPFEAWRDIYNDIAFAGQSVFDPYCGEGSGQRAAVNCGLQPRGCELNEGRFLRCLENMKAVYALIYQSNVSFT